MEELRAEGALQSDRYDELWKAHEVLLEETRSCVLESYSLAERSSGKCRWLARELKPRPRGAQAVNRGSRMIMLETPLAGTGDLGSRQRS